MKTPINIFRSWKSHCWRGDLNHALQVYTDQELNQIREHGYNGIWLNQKLSEYTPSRIIPEFGKNSARYLEVLDKLIQRARKHEVGVYLYLLEPRGLLKNDPFWRKHPDLKGQFWKEPTFGWDSYALCSSHPIVRAYLYDSVRQVTRQFPELAGFFAITAGEDNSTCVCKLWKQQHFHRSMPGKPLTRLETDLSCPRCKTKPIPEIIGDLLNLLYDAMVSGNPRCQLLAWDWGWDRLPHRETELSICKRIHKEIIFLSDFEIGGSRTILGKKHAVNEYSLGYTGPSPRFRKHVRFAKQNGRRIGAKLQIGTTHELATVPNLPLIHSIYRKVMWARANGVDAVLATWNFGNMPTLNTYAFGQAFTVSRTCNPHTFYHGIVRRYLHVNKAELALLMRAWGWFEKAMNHYPYSTPFIYAGPINYSPSYWLKPRPIQGTPLGLGHYVMERGDDLSACLGGYSLREVIEGLEKVSRLWDEGLSLYHQVLKRRCSPRMEEESRSAHCTACVFKSVLNIFRLYRLCLRWNARTSWEPYQQLCIQEKDNCRSLLPMLREDKRLGFHVECQKYLFSEGLVRKKLEMLERYIERSESTI